MSDASARPLSAGQSIAAANTLLRAWRRVRLNLWMCVAATKRAVEHFNKAIETAKAIGAKGIQGQVYLDHGRLHKAKGRNDQALDYFSRAVWIF